MIECVSWDETEMLLNPQNIEYCYLVKKDGYGHNVDHIMIRTISGDTMELRNGKSIYEELRKIK